MTAVAICGSAHAGFAAQPASATAEQVALKTPVPGGGGRSWVDLAALVFPDMQSELEIRHAAEAADPAKIFAEPAYLPERRIATAIVAFRPLAARFKMPEKMPPRFFIDGVAFVRVTGDGQPLLAALFGGGKGDSVAALALFEAGTQGRLLDLVQVHSDDWTRLLQRPALRLGPQAAAFVLVNAHDSHVVAYEEDTLVYVQGGRFVEIGGFSMDQSNLDCSGAVAEAAAFRVRPGGDKSHARIEAVVTRRETTRPEDCGMRHYKPMVKTSKAAGAWRWDAATQAYEAQASALGALGASMQGPD